MPRRLTRHHYEQLARDRQFEWVGDEVPRNVREKTTWRCQEGHLWEATFANIKYSGSGCHSCSHSVPKTEEDYRALAKRRGFKWLGPPVKNTLIRSEWQCSNGHVWLGRFSEISRGIGCPACAGIEPRREEDYVALAKKLEIEWLGPMPKNVKTKTKWRCEKQHTWSMTYKVVRQRGVCPICARNRVGVSNKPKTDVDYHALAKRRGFEWLGPTAKNSKTRTQWRCSYGHTWFAPYNAIQQGARCGQCQRLKRGGRPGAEALG